MSDLSDFIFLLPEQAAKAKYFEHGSDKVAEWEEGAFLFTVTRYPDGEWDVFLRFEDFDPPLDACTMDKSLASALRLVISSMLIQVLSKRSKIRDREDMDITALLAILSNAGERSEP